MKGSIAIQFNWIFVIIVGAAFLILFVVQSNNASNISRYENSLLLKQTLQSNIASGKLNKLENISLGFVQINNECLDGKTTLYFSKDLLPIETSYYVLHAPKRINSHKLTLQIIDGNSLLTADDHVYVFVKNNALDNAILPYFQAFGGNKILLNKLIDANQYPPVDSSLKYTLIFHNPANDQITYNPGAKTKPDVVVIQGNTLKFYKPLTINNLGNPKNINFFSLGEALGGIVDSDYAMYVCNHENQIMKEYRRLLLLYKKIGVIIGDDYTDKVTPYCKDLLGYTGVLVNDATELIYYNNAIVKDKEAEFLLKLAKINEVNTDLARNNCPLIE